MNNIQSKINSELRRPNAGKDALCNVVADVAEEIANNAGGGTSIPKLKVLRVEEITIDGDTAKVVIFDDASNEILDNLVGEEFELGGNSIISRVVSMDAESISLLNDELVNSTGSLVCTAMLTVEHDEDDTNILNYLFINPMITIIRYIEYPDVPNEEYLNKWFLD